MKYTLPKGTRILINGKAVAPRRVKTAHRVVYELREDMVVEHGESEYTVAHVVDGNGMWEKNRIGATFREKYDEVIHHSNREAATRFLTQD